jgi:PAS domain-containing protein
VRQIEYDSPFLMARAATGPDPIILEDLRATTAGEGIDTSHPPINYGGRGYLCVPLCYGETFEGTLTAIFTVPIARNSPEVQSLLGVGSYLAATFARARLHAEVEQDRTRMHAVLDQLPDGVLIAQSSSSVVSYAKARAAQILGVPLTDLVGSPFHIHIQAHGISQQYGRPIVPWHYAIIRAFCGETVSCLETVVTRPDGSRVFLLASSAPPAGRGRGYR